MKMLDEDEFGVKWTQSGEHGSGSRISWHRMGVSTVTENRRNVPTLLEQ